MASDPALEDRTSKSWTRLVDMTSTIGNQAVQALVTTIVLSIGFMAFNDFIAPIPDLTGRWKFTVVYEETANNRFQGLAVTYQVVWIQDGFKLSGHGEKLSDRGPKQDPVDYVGDQRANIELTGRITRRYFSPDVLVLKYEEVGVKRESSTIQRLTICSQDALGGCFLTTIADTSGPVWWQRIASRDDMYKPVEQPKGCDGAVDCSAAMTRSLTRGGRGIPWKNRSG